MEYDRPTFDATEAEKMIRAFTAVLFRYNVKSTTHYSKFGNGHLKSIRISKLIRPYKGSMRRRCKAVLIDFSLTVKATTLIFISWRGSAISSAKEGKSVFIYYLGKS